MARTILLPWLMAILLVAAWVPSIASAAYVESVLESNALHDMGSTLFAKVDSFRSRLGLIPYNYYSIPIPKPSEQRFKEEKVRENLGEVLLGSREQPSLYNFTVGLNISCAHVGTGLFTKKYVRRALNLCENEYYGAVSLDGLPALSQVQASNGVIFTRYGYRFGSGKTINNLLAFTVRYAPRADGKALITAFTVEPRSYTRVTSCSADAFDVESDAYATLPPVSTGTTEAPAKIDFYYSATWVMDVNGTYLDRVAAYDKTVSQKRRQKKGHWTAAVNAVLLTFLLGAAVAVVVVRTVRRDLLQYADEELTEGLQEETGWKLIRGDVFRPPRFPVAFACVISSGCQALMMVFSVFLASVLGILHPGQRGNLLTGLIVSFLLSSFFAGYVGARMLKFFKQRSWANGLLTVVSFPLGIVGSYMTLNFIHWFKHSTSAIPFATCLSLITSWFAISVPLGITGVTLGFRAAAFQAPSKVSTIPRLIPLEATRQMWYHLAFGGLVPFSAGFVELVYVLMAFWQGERFHLLGFFTAVSAIAAVLCGEVAIVITYLALNSEDYRWWWRSFLSLAFSGFYLYIYGVFYLVMYLELRLLSSIILFLGYMFGISAVFGLMCGTLGFLSAASFVSYIYVSAKSD